MEQNQQQPAVKTKICGQKEQIAGCLKDQRQSGLPVKDYCEVNNTSEKTFYRWLKNHDKKVPRQPSGDLLPKVVLQSIELVESVADPKPRLFAEIGNIRLYKEMPAEYLKMLIS
jgi:hypothetical protein